MKCIQGAIAAAAVLLLAANVATAQFRRTSQGTSARGVSHATTTTTTTTYAMPPQPSYGCYGGTCGNGCCPPDDCCNPCQKHGLAVLWERMKAKMQEAKCKRSCCQSTCCEPVCKAEPTCCAEPTCEAEPTCCAEPTCEVEPCCQADTNCCHQKTCCPYPISCAPELGPCCAKKKPFSLCDLFKGKKKNCCESACCDSGCCDSGCCNSGFTARDYPPTSHRGGYPSYHHGYPEPVESYPPAPRQQEQLMPPAPPKPSVEQTSTDRYRPARSVAPQPQQRTSSVGRRGPI